MWFSRRSAIPRRRRPRFIPASLLLSLGLLVLLGGLAVLQYRWVGQVSEAERQRMQASLRARAEQFAEEFDREVARAFFWLQVEADLLHAKDWTRYAERYDRWRASTNHPELARSVWLFADDATPRRYNTRARAFEAAPLPQELSALWDEAKRHLLDPSSDPLANLKWLHAVRADIPAIVAPSARVLFDRREALRIEHLEPLPVRGFTVVLLDREYIRGRMLPGLAARYFAGANGLEYQLSITSRDGRTVFNYGPEIQRREDRADVTLSFFDVRPQALAELRTTVGSTHAPRTPAGPATARQFNLVLVDPKPDAGRVQGERRIALSTTGPAQGAHVLPRFAIPGAQWQLALRHRAGSLEAAVATARRRNLVISSGILALLGASVVLIALSAQRASRLAEQQIEFVAAITHELRTPLAVIRSAGENLADGVVTESDQVRRYGELVRCEGRRLTTMVEQVLAFAGIRSGDGLRRRPEVPRDLIDRALESAGPELESAGLRVEVQVPPDLPRVTVDGDAIVRALANLLVNAAKYAAEGGRVDVSAAVARAGRRAEEFHVTVADRGPGIAGEDLSHIFEPFFRAPSVVASPVRGTGLGLSLVDAIARAHGGRATVRSVPGQGSAFTLILPHVTEPAHARAGSPVAASRP